MTDDGTPLSNDVEVDEAYTHPNLTRNTRLKPKLPGKRFYDSEIVFVMVMSVITLPVMRKYKFEATGS
jgi:hypothetical protein